PPGRLKPRRLHCAPALSVSWVPYICAPPSARSLGRCHPDQEKPTILVSLERRSALRLQRRSLLRVCDVTARKSPPDDCPWKTMCHYSSTSTVVHWRQPALSSVRRHRHYGPWPGHQSRL